jgi:hypothetical protein
MKIALIMNECPLGTESRGGTETYNTFLYEYLVSEGHEVVPVYRDQHATFDHSPYDLVIVSDWDLWCWSAANFDHLKSVFVLHMDSFEHRRFIECFPRYRYVIQHEGGTEKTLVNCRSAYTTIYGTSRLEGLKGCELRMELPEKFSIVVSSPLEEKGVIRSIDDIISRGGHAVYVGCDEDRPLVNLAREMGATIYGRATPAELATLMDKADELVHLPLVWRESNPLVMIEGYSRGLKAVGNERTPAFVSDNLRKDRESIMEWYSSSRYSNREWKRRWSELVSEYEGGGVE